MIDSSEALISRFDPAVGLIRSWNNKDGKANPFRVIIDNMMNLEMLFLASEFTGDSRYRDIAVTHADNTLNHFRADNSCSTSSVTTPERAASSRRRADRAIRRLRPGREARAGASTDSRCATASRTTAATSTAP
ncbi:MAG: hypothetical protein V8Q54_04645 [Alistipes senegalensis]